MIHIDKLIHFIDKNIFITVDEAKRVGISQMMLSRLVASEKLFRTEHGIYTNDFSWLTDPLKKYAVACTKYPSAVICGISALNYYDLTDAEERQISIAVPSSQRINNSKYHAIRLTGIAYTLGLKKQSVGKRQVRIYDTEKTIVDAFKYLTIEIAMKALKNYMKRKDKNVQKLCDYARKLGKPLDDTVTAIWAED